jgi:hypothetical protein
MNHHSVVFDITIKTHQELTELYGIEIDDDGIVFDPYSYTYYDTIQLWAAEMDADTDDMGGFTRGSGKQDYWEE